MDNKQSGCRVINESGIMIIKDPVTEWLINKLLPGKK